MKLSMTYSAYKEMEQIPGPLLCDIGETILKLPENPLPAGSAVLEGQGGCLYIPLGDYYILYHINEKNTELTVLGVVEGPIATLH